MPARVPVHRQRRSRTRLPGMLSAPLFSLLLALPLTLSISQAMAQEISSFAFVQDDGSLKVSGNLIYLAGIYIPQTDRTCSTFIRPMPCGTRASLALDFRISGHFVHCLPRYYNSDGSIVASCRADGEDLAAWMLQHGWALALPDAPFEYVAMERLAQAKQIGIWGIPVEAAPRRR